jgi:hypothetical protein
MVVTHLANRLSRSVLKPAICRERKRVRDRTYERPPTTSVMTHLPDNDLVQNSGAPFDQFNYSGIEGFGLMRMWSDATKCSDRRLHGPPKSADEEHRTENHRHRLDPASSIDFSTERHDVTNYADKTLLAKIQPTRNLASLTGAD